MLQNYQRTRAADFADQMITSLDRLHPPAFRIHDVGDFYSPTYARKWLKIIRARPDARFFAYTRSWRLPEVVQELARLAAEPNMVLLLSLDRSMLRYPIPDELTHLPRTWLATTDSDIPPANLHVDLVFRNLRRKLTRLDDLNHFGSMVCPAETGHGKVTCEQCRFCWLRCNDRNGDGTDDKRMIPLPLLAR